MLLKEGPEAGITLEGLEGRPMSEEEREQLSERRRNREGVRAKRRKEIEEMQPETMEVEVGEIEKILARRIGAARLSGPGSMLLVLTISCLMGGASECIHGLRQ